MIGSSKPRRRLAYVCFALLALVLLAAPGASPAGKEHKRQHTKRHPIYWGAWIGSQITGAAPPFDMSAASRFEEIVGKGMSLLEFSSPFEHCERGECHFFGFPEEAMQNVRNHGSIPFFSWGSEVTPRETVEQPESQLSDLIEGRYDAYIAQFATEARDWGHPFFLRFNWEMNGNWFPWSEGVNGNGPGEYVAAWRHVHDIFASVGASNATWVWCPYADEKHKFRNIKAFYPGAGYVDWTCTDGYNWGKNSVNPQKWKSFSQLFGSTYTQLKKIAKRKPIMLAEFASSPDGGHKAVWITRMFEDLPRKYPLIRGLIWFDALDRGVDWPIETSGTAIKAFSKGISRGIFPPNRFGELATSPIKPLR